MNNTKYTSQTKMATMSVSSYGTIVIYACVTDQNRITVLITCTYYITTVTTTHVKLKTDTISTDFTF
jgi:hypothetical protein